MGKYVVGLKQMNMQAIKISSYVMFKARNYIVLFVKLMFLTIHLSRGDPLESTT